MSISFSSVKPTLAGDRADIFPAMVPVRQRFFAGAVRDTAAAVTGGLAGLDLASLQGKKIALTAGSRGIKAMVEVLRAVVGLPSGFRCRAIYCPGDGQSWRGDGRRAGSCS